jgi:hypothetical protein
MACSKQKLFLLTLIIIINVIIINYSPSYYTPQPSRQQAAQWQLERALLVMKMAYIVFENSSAVAARALLVTEVASSASNLFILVL